jgi:hypothetical protein
MAASDDPMATLERAQQAFDRTLSATAGGTQPWSRELVMSLAFGVLGFTFAILILVTILLWRQRAQPLQVLRVFGVVTIIGVSTLLLVVGYSNEQLTPIIGLFGAIAGYLLGRDASRQGHDAPEPPKGRAGDE